MTVADHKILIIGAGPAGLAIAGRLRKKNIEFQIIEAKDNLAASWRGHYDRLHLHTVKQWSHLPHMPFPDSYPLYVPKDKLVSYLESYAETFDIRPQYKTTVQSIKKTSSPSWQVSCQNGQVYKATQVVIATGVNRVPRIPDLENKEIFQGQIIHSRNYKNHEPYKDKRVMVVGMGNTGAEIALDLSEYGIRTYLSVRGPVNIVPRDLNGRPVQVTAKKLSRLPFGIGTWLGTQIRKLYIGDLTKYGIPSPNMSPTKQLLETGKTPVIDIGTVKQIKAGKIKVTAEISRLGEDHAILTDGSKIELDAIILCTGYQAKIEELVENAEILLDQHGCPSAAICKDYHEGLYFIGFDNYKLGGILGIIMEESERISDHIQQTMNIQAQANSNASEKI